jgi:asparagine synthetase B (glutamine-hydrolysing)
MPDLAVYFDGRGESDTQEIASRFRRILKGDGGTFDSASEVDAHLAAVNVLKPFACLKDQPLYGENAWLMLDGAIYRDPATESAAGEFDETRELKDLLQELACNEHSRLDRLNGQFNLLVYQQSEKRLRLVTDRLGSRPLYHGTSRGRHVVSSELKAVVAGLGDTIPISPLGLLEFFAFGHNLAERTVLEGVEVLPPGSVIFIDERGMRAEPYFRYRYAADGSLKSAAETGERIAACVRDAVPRHLQGPGRKAFFLSGGLDSRIIAGAMGRDRHPLHAFTFGYPESRDVRFAAQLADLLGFPHHVLTYPEVYLSEVIEQVVERTECVTPFYHTTSTLFHDRIAEEADEIVVGFCGDVFSGGHLRPPMFKVGPGPELTGMIFDRAACADRRLLAGILQPHALEQYWPAFIEAFSSTVGSIREQSGPDTADVWDVENRQRRFTFTAPKVDRSRFEIVAPLLDNGIVDLVLTLPARMRRGQAAYKHAIVKGFPLLRDVPWAATGRPISTSPLGERAGSLFRFAGQAFRHGLARIGLSKASLGWQFRNVGEEMRRDTALFQDHLGPFLVSDRFPEDLLNRSGIMKLADDHLAGRIDATHLLGCLLTLAVFSRIEAQWERGE